MTLSPEERAALALPPDNELDDMPSTAEVAGAPRREGRKRDAARAAERTQGRFAASAAAHLDVVEQQIGDLLAAGLIDAYEAAIHRLYVTLLRDKDTRPADRTKAIEGLAKLRGLFVQKIKHEGETFAGKSTQELLLAVAERFNMPVTVLRGARPVDQIANGQPALRTLPG